MRVALSKSAEKDMDKLPKETALRIGEKLQWFVDQDDPLSFAEPLHGTSDKLYRFRIGNYRAIFTIKGSEIKVLFVMTVKHRREAY